MANDGRRSPDLTLDDVRHLAMLARVSTIEEDLEKMRGQLSSILDSIRVLADVDTEGVEPTAHAIAVENVFRDDESRASMDRDDVLRNAPSSQEGYVRVRAVFDE